MRRSWMSVTMVFLLAGSVALAGEEIRSPGAPDLRQAARRTVANPLADIADRKAAVWILGRGPDGQDDDLRCLADILIPQTPLELQLTAVEAMSRSPQPRASEVLLSNWTQHGPKVHAAVVAVLLWREPWLGALEVESAAAPSWPRHWTGHAGTSRYDIPRRTCACARRNCELPEQPSPKPASRSTSSCRRQEYEGMRPEERRCLPRRPVRTATRWKMSAGTSVPT